MDRRGCRPRDETQGEKPPLDIDDATVRDTLNRLDVADWCDDRDGWLKVGMALHHQYQGDDAGFEMWCEFSQQSDKFNEEDQRRVWDSFKGNPNAATFASLMHETRDSRLRDKFEDLGDEPTPEEDDLLDFGSGPAKDKAQKVAEAASKFKIEAYVYVPPNQLPPREWLYSTCLIRGYVSILVAPGGVGKSVLALTECIALACGREILGEKCHEGASRPPTSTSKTRRTS